MFLYEKWYSRKYMGVINFDFKFHLHHFLSDEFEQVLSISQTNMSLFVNWESCQLP